MTISTTTLSNNSTTWTAEDFERYGAKLAAEAELAAKAEMEKEAEKSEIEPYQFSFEIPPKAKARFAELEAMRKIQLEMEGDRVRKQYGVVENRDVIKILDVEAEITKCRNCEGLPCKKEMFDHQNETPTVTFDKEKNKVVSRYQLCHYEKMRRFNKKFGLAKIPPEYLGKTFEDYQVDANNTQAVKVAKKLIEIPDKGAFFYGNVGTGKTLLAAIIAQEVIKSGREVIFATVPMISAKIRSTFNRTPKRNAIGELMYKQPLTEEEILDKLATVPTLILDDVGMEKPTRFVCSTLCNIFNERYNARLQTIMTSNYSLKELEKIFNNPSDDGATLDGTRMYDRCKQMCFPIELKGNSRRK